MRTSQASGNKFRLTWGRALLLVLAATLIIGMCGFYLTGPVNKVAAMANAPAPATSDRLSH